MLSTTTTCTGPLVGSSLRPASFSRAWNRERSSGRCSGGIFSRSSGLILSGIHVTVMSYLPVRPFYPDGTILQGAGESTDKSPDGHVVNSRPKRWKDDVATSLPGLDVGGAASLVSVFELGLPSPPSERRSGTRGA